MWEILVHSVNCNFVSHDADGKIYIEISSKGGPAVFTASKRDSMGMWNHSLFHSRGIVGIEVGHSCEYK